MNIGVNDAKYYILKVVHTCSHRSYLFHMLYARVRVNGRVRVYISSKRYEQV
jgi:hypothetical protein